MACTKCEPFLTANQLEAVAFLDAGLESKVADCSWRARSVIDVAIMSQSPQAVRSLA